MKSKENAKLKSEVEQLHSSQEYYLTTIQELTLYNKIVEDQLKQFVLPENLANKITKNNNNNYESKQSATDTKRLQELVNSLEEEKKKLQDEVLQFFYIKVVLYNKI